MERNKLLAFMKDLAPLLEKHGLMGMTMQSDNPSKLTKSYDGVSLFFTEGLPSKNKIEQHVKGGNNIKFKTSHIIRITKQDKDFKTIIRVTKNRNKE